MFPDLMIDIECLATGSDAVVTQIGMVAFNIKTMEAAEGTYVNLMIQEQLDAGRVITGKTLKWWLGEIELAGGVCTWVGREFSVTAAIQELQRYTSQYCSKGFNQWSHTFDQQILSHLAYQFKHKLPWSYRQQRDIRTLTCLAGATKRKSDTVHQKTHNALEDCEYQVEYCCEAWKSIHDK